jgi:hypothetical protein
MSVVPAALVSVVVETTFVSAMKSDVGFWVKCIRRFFGNEGL